MIARSRRYPAGGSVITRHLTIIYCANFPTSATLLSVFVFVFVFSLLCNTTSLNMCVICNITFHVYKIVITEAALQLEWNQNV